MKNWRPVPTSEYKVHCRCEADPQLRCDVTTATHLYRIAQEALNNVLKHSGASHITLHIRQSSEGLELLESRTMAKV